MDGFDKVPIPKETLDIANNGYLLSKELFTKIENFTSTKKVRRLSKRAGQWEFTVQSWDERKIYNYLKKNAPFKCKTEKEGKILKRFIKEIKDFIKTEDYVKVREHAESYLKVFVVPENKVRKTIDSVKTLCDVILSEEKTSIKLEEELRRSNARHAQLSEDLERLEKELEHQTRKVNALPAVQEIKKIEKEIRALRSGEDFKFFETTLRNSLHRVIDLVKKRQIESPIDRQALEGFYDSFLDTNVDLSIYSRDLVPLIVSSTNFFASKRWYTRKIGSPEKLEELLTGNGLETTKQILLLERKLLGQKKALNQTEEVYQRNLLSENKSKLEESREKNKQRQQSLQSHLNESQGTFMGAQQKLRSFIR